MSPLPATSTASGPSRATVWNSDTGGGYDDSSPESIDELSTASRKDCESIGYCRRLQIAKAQ